MRFNREIQQYSVSRMLSVRTAVCNGILLVDWAASVIQSVYSISKYRDTNPTNVSRRKRPMAPRLEAACANAHCSAHTRPSKYWRAHSLVAGPRNLRAKCAATFNLVNGLTDSARSDVSRKRFTGIGHTIRQETGYYHVHSRWCFRSILLVGAQDYSTTISHSPPDIWHSNLIGCPFFILYCYHSVRMPLIYTVRMCVWFQRLHSKLLRHLPTFSFYRNLGVFERMKL